MLSKYTIILFFLSLLKTDLYHVTANAFTTVPGNHEPAKEIPVGKYFPFELQQSGGRFQIIANLESEKLHPYYGFFLKHGYEGNGYCWEGHIIQILEKLDKNLLSHIDFDPEAGAFYARADSKEHQVKFVELLCPIFSDMKKLEEWVKKADRSRIND